MRVIQRNVVAVVGSGVDEHADLAESVGRLVAEEGWDLLTGGGGGVMAAAARGFTSVAGRGGISIGVLPAGRPPEKYPNEWIELVIQTHLPLSGEQGMEELSRNHINVLSAHAVVALPGGAGTISEVLLALRYGRPVALVGDKDQFEGFPSDAPLLALGALRGWLRGVIYDAA